jgi:D-arabinose 5-phosphate isomerase GutQ
MVNLLPKTQPEAPTSTVTWKEDYCKDSQMITTEKTDHLLGTYLRDCKLHNNTDHSLNPNPKLTQQENECNHNLMHLLKKHR